VLVVGEPPEIHSVALSVTTYVKIAGSMRVRCPQGGAM
jgi:hypothetical protein